jgi:lipopolysaccharide export LptBFGC system permease protein LptF
MARLHRIVKYLSLGVVICGSSILAAMLIWAYRLDADFSGRYACCTQAADAEFHRQFWWNFFLGAKVFFAGCLGLAATLASRTLFKVGWRTLGASIALFFVNFAFMGVHNWSGSTTFTITQVVFCSAVTLLIVGAMRVGWTKVRF